MNIYQRVFVFTVLPTILVGCTSGVSFHNHGEVVSHNMDAQVVNETVAVAMGSPELDGPKAQQVMKTYRSDTGKATGDQIVVNIGN